MNNQIPTKQRTPTCRQEYYPREILAAYSRRTSALAGRYDDASPLSGYHRQLVSVLGLARIETFLPGWQDCQGARHLNARPWHAPSSQKLCSAFRPPPADRHAIGRPDIAPLMRLASAGEVPQQINVLARLRGLRAASALHRGARRADQANADRLVRHISPGDTASEGREIEVREKPMRPEPAIARSASQAQTRSSTQGTEFRPGRPKHPGRSSANRACH